ncbi:MAG: C-GCAxxG-C-C family protein [Bacteroidales bacterium]|nr:C-GCAxxG-C-C family protein [Bacteroidales bacterium]
MDRSEKALSYFDNKFNCSQSVLTAFADESGLTEDESLKVACAFGGGMGRQQFTCGAVTGAAMALGLKFGKGLSDEDEKKQLTYDKTVELFDEFTKLNGSTTCRKLLNDLDMRNENELNLINEQNLFHTNCRKYVADAVKITERILAR